MPERSVSRLERGRRRVKRLPAAAGLALRAWLALAEIDMQLHRRGFRQCLAACSRLGASAQGTADVGARAQRYVSAIERAARCYPGTARCLQQSLVLHRWLRRDGAPTKLQIGVLRVEREFRAHAWVELDGRVLNDRAAAVRPFTPLATQGAAIAT